MPARTQSSPDVMPRQLKKYSRKLKGEDDAVT
jgi:hypothetical protein